jgi:hypothetical protein
MRVAFFFNNECGVSTPQLALIASGLALASLVGVRVLQAPLAVRSQAVIAAESQTDLERLARSLPPARGRIAGLAAPAATGQIDFTATANSSTKRTLQPACHGGMKTVSMVAPAGGPPIVLSTCASGKN